MRGSRYRQENEDRDRARATASDGTVLDWWEQVELWRCDVDRELKDDASWNKNLAYTTPEFAERQGDLFLNFEYRRKTETGFMIGIDGQSTPAAVYVDEDGRAYYDANDTLPLDDVYKAQA